MSGRTYLRVQAVTPATDQGGRVYVIDIEVS